MIRAFGKGLLVLGLMLVLSGSAQAWRTPSVRTMGEKSTGARTDITVPYLNHGLNAFQGYSVAVRIYASPEVIDLTNPGAKPVYNIIFYGSRLSFGTASTGPRERFEVQSRP